MPKIACFCVCGAQMTCREFPDPIVAAELESTWWEHHQGEGHGATDARAAGNARRRNERRHAREWHERAGLR